ncbi:DUF3348 domain-containing protein [Paraburkholderia sp. MMS20-SJTN17]|uniref:DUF3348 domain-containing protein n=1 Tax=Paraburkholderia translucens TaxID=2886945 RepID=A0ABS8K7P3_9BURK|nr:DUF3348 domain-containing protein [Paraburkholderia sp. MMS20-SJTN17]MCC8400771.1 DUF3348 domain-containing protein [Paraburkholderia sp. MMS20-SJTN17]
MLQAPQRSALSGPALVRLLARLAEADVAESRQSLADRLSQWLGWTDAIALSSALNAKPPAVAAGARAFGQAEEDECTRVRRSLVNAIASDSVLAGSRRRGSAASSARMSAHAAIGTQADYAVFRQRYLALQQSMETAIGTLRGRLRALLATQAPALARLAVVDAVMERALGERERTLLGAVPGLLGAHFERSRAGAEAANTTPSVDIQLEVASVQANAAASGAWLDAFRKDMQSVLLAELDVRFQPVEGLLAALRAC